MLRLIINEYLVSFREHARVRANTPIYVGLLQCRTIYPDVLARPSHACSFPAASVAHQHGRNIHPPEGGVSDPIRPLHLAPKVGGSLPLGKVHTRPVCGPGEHHADVFRGTVSRWKRHYKAGSNSTVGSVRSLTSSRVSLG